MKSALVLFTCAALMPLLACSGASMLERANLTTVEARRDYVRLHPEGVHNGFIQNGEIVPGMNVHEVIASWGLPNVYVVQKVEPSERWIYYLKDRDSLMLLVYTLSFSADTLQVWHVDQKRYVGQGIVSRDESVPEIPISTINDLRKK